MSSYIGYIKVVHDRDKNLFYLLINSRKQYPLIPTKAGMNTNETIQEYCAIHYNEHIVKTQIKKLEVEGQIVVCVIIMDSLPLDIDATQNKLQWIPYLYLLNRNSNRNNEIVSSRKTIQNRIIPVRVITEKYYLLFNLTPKFDINYF